MKIAITGSDGFIGKHLTSSLQAISEKIEIIELSRKNGFDITNDNFTDYPDFDILCHLAAKVFVPDSYENPYDFYKTNVIGTLNMLEVCRQKKAKIVFLSSYVYGVPKYQPIDENHTIDSFNPYSNTKIIGEQLCKGYNIDYHIPVVIIRPFNTYGPGQNENFLMPLIIKQALNGKIELKDPSPRRDMVYIQDLIDAIIKSIFYTKSTFEIFNIGSGKSFSVEEIVNQVCDSFNKKIDVEYSGEIRQNEVKDTIADITKAKELLDWEPKYTLEKGINELLDNK